MMTIIVTPKEKTPSRDITASRKLLNRINKCDPGNSRFLGSMQPCLCSALPPEASESALCYHKGLVSYSLSNPQVQMGASWREASSFKKTSFLIKHPLHPLPPLYLSVIKFIQSFKNKTHMLNPVLFCFLIATSCTDTEQPRLHRRNLSPMLLYPFNTCESVISAFLVPGD